MRRNRVFIICILCVFALGLLCHGALAEDKEPIKVGFLTPLTGWAAGTGADMVNGFKMYWDEVGYKVGDRKIEVIVEDGRGLPETNITKFRKLITHDKCVVVVGLVTSPSGLAVSDVADQLKAPLVITSSAPDDLTQRRLRKWAVRISWTGSQPSFPFGKYVAEKLGYKKVACIGIDFQFGYDTVGGFQKTFEEAGGQIIQKQWFPTTTVDFGPYIARIRRDADALFANTGGASALKLPRQFREAGFKMPLIGTGTTSDEFILQTQGDEILGYISPLQYSAALDIPANRKFQEKYQPKYNKVGSYYAAHGYDGAMWVEKAIKMVNGDVSDNERFLAALKKVELPNSTRGPLKLDEYGNPIQNIYIRKVEKIENYTLDFMKKGPLKWNIVIDTYPNVSQFWTYDPKEYMSQPVYSPKYPPCKYCE